jgi:hypothetical protein
MDWQNMIEKILLMVGLKRRFIKIDVLSDGDCFYRSLFVCLRHNGGYSNKYFSVPNVSNVSNVSNGAEDLFVKKIRKVLSQHFRCHCSDFDILTNFYREAEIVDRDVLLQSFPDWCVNALKTSANLVEFRNLFADRVAESGTRVSELEIKLVQQLFVKNTPFRILVFQSEPFVSNKIKKNTLYIGHIGDMHYNAFVLQK